MALTTIANFSGFTDNAPLSPSYFNSKMTEIVSMITAVNSAGTDFGAAAGTVGVNVTGGVVVYDGSGNAGASITSNGFASFGTGSAIQPGIRFTSEQSLGFHKSGDSTIAMSYGTFNLATGGVRLSMRTVAAASLDSTTLAVNEIAFSVGGASGASLAIRSGSTIYYFSSSLSTKA